MKSSLLFILLVWICDATANEPNPTTAQASVTHWLKLLDDEKYEETWETAAPPFKEALTAKQWSRAVRNARKPLGLLVSRDLIGAQYTNKLPSVPEGDYLIFQFKSSFEKKDEVIETITPMLIDGRWRISGYFVR